MPSTALLRRRESTAVVIVSLGNYYYYYYYLNNSSTFPYFHIFYLVIFFIQDIFLEYSFRTVSFPFCVYLSISSSPIFYLNCNGVMQYFLFTNTIIFHS